MLGTLLVGLGTAVGRNAFGWLKNSLEDGKIQDYEVKKGIISTLVTIVVFTGTYFGLESLDASASEWISSAITLMISPFIEKVFKKFGWFQSE